MHEIREKYIERIYELKRDKGYVRATDLANLLNVKPSSVTEMLQKLALEGYVVYEKYRVIDLTPKGLELAKNLEMRHHAIKKLLMYMGVDENTADRDACLVEHILSQETLEKIQEFTQKI